LESEARNFTTAEIAEATGIRKYEVSLQAAVLAAKGLIEKPIYGQWKAKNQFASLQSPKETRTPQTSNTAPFNGQPDIPDGIAPEEYRECYDTAYSAFINDGLPPDEADRKARDEIRKFIDGYVPPGSGAAVSSPTMADEEIDF
jgi:hypothetical protein